jgi:hypothetical protein
VVGEAGRQMRWRVVGMGVVGVVVVVGGVGVGQRRLIWSVRYHPIRARDTTHNESHHIISHHITSRHTTCQHLTTHHTTSQHITSHHVTSHRTAHHTAPTYAPTDQTAAL